MGTKPIEEILENTNYFYNNDLIEFEKLNITTKNIYELGNYDVLIILENGKNITSYNSLNEDEFEKIKFISQNLSNFTDETFKVYVE